MNYTATQWGPPKDVDSMFSDANGVCDDACRRLTERMAMLDQVAAGCPLFRPASRPRRVVRASVPSALMFSFGVLCFYTDIVADTARGSAQRGRSTVPVAHGASCHLESAAGGWVICARCRERAGARKNTRSVISGVGQPTDRLSGRTGRNGCGLGGGVGAVSDLLGGSARTIRAIARRSTRSSRRTSTRGQWKCVALESSLTSARATTTLAIASRLRCCA